MRSRGWRDEAVRFHSFLLQLYEEGKEKTSKEPLPLVFQTDVQGYLIHEECANPLENLWTRNGAMYVFEKVRPCEDSCELDEQQQCDSSGLGAFPQEDCSALALPLSRARQLLSFYTVCQNPNMMDLETNKSVLLPPLWIRCDRSDPKQTIWLGGEPVLTGKKITGITLHTITCSGPVSIQNHSTDLEELKQIHRLRHRCSFLTTKGFACYTFLEVSSLGSLSLEDTLIPSERNVFAEFAWNTVTGVLQRPPLTSTATLNIQMASGSPLSTMYELNRELHFLLSLADILKNGRTEWPQPSGSQPVIELVQKLLKDLKDEVQGLKKPNGNDAEHLQDDTAAIWRGDLDFLEQLWCKIWKNVTTYEELLSCFVLVMQSLQCGELKTWIHQGSNSSLSKLIKQSYHENIEPVPLSGETPVRMLLEIGVDKMKRDYSSYFVGKEFAIRSHLEYFMSSSVDLQEQVQRIQKLHHMLEIVDNCVKLLKLENTYLISLTQSCISYYKENPLNEKHTFRLPVSTTSVKEFCQNASPQLWKVEVGSERRQKNVQTVWQLSTTLPAKHMSPGLLDDTEASDKKEEMYFITLAECSQVYFA